MVPGIVVSTGNTSMLLINDLVLAHEVTDPRSVVLVLSQWLRTHTAVTGPILKHLI